jgi:2-oxo-4-hydroxy-4-carboxy-5-ureidoimidazoline decarboxylase
MVPAAAAHVVAALSFENWRMMTMLTLDALNAMPREAFVSALGDVFEHAPWVADGVADKRPFATVSALHAAMLEVVKASPADRQLLFVKGHPELGSKVARADLTRDSQAEQGSLGLDRLSDAEFARFQKFNTDYRSRFGFPFIIAVRRHTRDSILANFERRLANSAGQELATAVAEIGRITALRLAAKVDGPGPLKTAGRLSTHVLDTVHGKPAAGVSIELFEIGASARGLLKTVTTNADGRTDTPLIAGEPLRIGTYELVFHAGDYFRRLGVAMAEPAFVDVVPLRFSIAEPEGHYHVPLLVTPWSFSTYRGS